MFLNSKCSFLTINSKKSCFLQDQGNPPRSSTTTLHVNVIDADDQNPAFVNDQYKVTVPRHIKGVRLTYFLDLFFLKFTLIKFDSKA